MHVVMVEDDGIGRREQPVVAGTPLGLAEYLLTPRQSGERAPSSYEQATGGQVPSLCHGASARRRVHMSQNTSVPPHGRYGCHLGQAARAGRVEVCGGKGRGRDEGHWAVGSRAATCGALMKVPRSPSTVRRLCG